MYILLDKGKVREIIPDIAPMFPGIPIEARYTAEFVASPPPCGGGDKGPAELDL